jgi:RNA polymerase sporulation-specific sigma factor
MSTVADYEGLCRWFASRYFIPGADRDDVMQEARIGAWQGLRDFDTLVGMAEVSFVAMCIKRQIFTAMKMANFNKRRVLSESVRFPDKPPFGVESTWAEIIPATLSDPAVIAQHRDDLSRILAMPLSELEALVLAHMIAGSSYREAAADMGKSTKSVDNAMQRIRRKATVELAA